MNIAAQRYPHLIKCKYTQHGTDQFPSAKELDDWGKAHQVIVVRSMAPNTACFPSKEAATMFKLKFGGEYFYIGNENERNNSME